MNIDDAIDGLLNAARTASGLYCFEADTLVELLELIVQRETLACTRICDEVAEEYDGTSDGFYAARNCAVAISSRMEERWTEN